MLTVWIFPRLTRPMVREMATDARYNLRVVRRAASYCICLLIFFAAYGCVLFDGTASDDGSDYSDGGYVAPTEVPSEAPTDTPQNPVSLFIGAEHSAFDSAAVGMSSASGGGFQTASACLDVFSHQAALEGVFASVGMLYGYDGSWYGTLTGVYGGSGTITVHNGCCKLSYSFDSGAVLNGTLENCLLTCQTTDADGVLTSSVMLFENKGVYTSVVFDGKYYSVLTVTDEVSFAGGIAELPEGFDICSHADVEALLASSDIRFDYCGGVASAD